MKYFSFLLIAIAVCSIAVAQTASVSNASHKNIYDFKIKSLTGGSIDFSQYKGKKILIVNTASKCGSTPQYKGLEELYEANKDKLMIVGFPSDNFAGQEFQQDSDIHSF